MVPSVIGLAIKFPFDEHGNTIKMLQSEIDKPYFIYMSQLVTKSKIHKKCCAKSDYDQYTQITDLTKVH